MMSCSPLTRRVLAGAVCAAALTASMGAEGGCTSTSSGSKAADNGSSSSSAPSAEDSTPTLTPRMYAVRVKTLSKQCFGSAGCNVNVRLELGYKDFAAKGVAAEITVKIIGDESGSSIETINLDEDGSYNAPEVLLSTSRSSTAIKAKITEVVAA